MLKKPLPGPARLMLGAGLAVLASSAGAAALWQQQPATVVTLPAVSLAAAAAPLPPLAVQGRLPAPAPARLPSLATVATAAPAAPPEALRPMAAPAPVVAKAATPVAARAPIAGAAPVAVPAVAPVAPKAEVSTGRAPLPAPLKAQRIYDYSQNPPLPPPPMPRPEPALPAPQVVLDPSDNPGADAAGYEAPRVLVAKMAQRPLLARSSLAGGQVQGMVMQVKLDAEGKPTEAVVHGNSLGPVYERNALKAVKRWRFEPARRAGEAVPATVLATVWFLNADRSTSIQAQSLSHPLPRNMQPPQAIASQ